MAHRAPDGRWLASQSKPSKHSTAQRKPHGPGGTDAIDPRTRAALIEIKIPPGDSDFLPVAPKAISSLNLQDCGRDPWVKRQRPQARHGGVGPLLTSPENVPFQPVGAT